MSSREVSRARRQRRGHCGSPIASPGMMSQAASRPWRPVSLMMRRPVSKWSSSSAALAAGVPATCRRSSGTRCRVSATGDHSSGRAVQASTGRMSHEVVIRPPVSPQVGTATPASTGSCPRRCRKPPDQGTQGGRQGGPSRASDDVRMAITLYIPPVTAFCSRTRGWTAATRPALRFGDPASRGYAVWPGSRPMIRSAPRIADAGFEARKAMSSVTLSGRAGRSWGTAAGAICTLRAPRWSSLVRLMQCLLSTFGRFQRRRYRTGPACIRSGPATPAAG